MKKRFWLIWLPLLLALAGGAAAQTVPAAPPPSRDPDLRQVEPGMDDATLKRIEIIRGRLPVQYQRRNNFAWAIAKIDGLDKVEYFAHSGIQNLDDLSEEAKEQIEGISLKPLQGRFKTLCVNQNGAVEGADCWQRDVDTEYKILEDMAGRLPDPSVSGRMRLYTELYPCPSCWNVMKQFLAIYTNVQMQVLYNRP